MHNLNDIISVMCVAPGYILEGVGKAGEKSEIDDFLKKSKKN